MKQIGKAGELFIFLKTFFNSETATLLRSRQRNLKSIFFEYAGFASGGWFLRVSKVDTFPYEEPQSIDENVKVSTFPNEDSQSSDEDVKVGTFPYESSPFSDVNTAVGFMLYAEHQPTGVRITEYYDWDAKLVSRSYYDRGDIPKKVLEKLLRGWEANVMRGRPLEESTLPISTEEVGQLIDSRNEWYTNSEDSRDYDPTIDDAAEQLAALLGEINHTTADEESVERVNKVLRELDKYRKRQRKK